MRNLRFLAFVTLALVTHDRSLGQQAWYEPAVTTLPNSSGAHFAIHHEARTGPFLIDGAGSLGTWERVGCQWNLLGASTPSLPAPSGVVYDAWRQVIVAARDESTRFGMYEFNGTWARRPDVPGPVGRTDFGLAYDVCNTGRTILFGGQRNGVLMGDTHTWDGTNWTVEAPAASPGPRHSHAMGNASWGAGGALLHGGKDSIGATLGTAWIGNRCGTVFTWRSVSVAQGPPPLSGHSMAAAGAVGVLMAGGKYANGQASKEVWRYDVGTGLWTRWADLPFAFDGKISMTYNRFTDRLWIFGRKPGATDLTSLVSVSSTLIADMPLLTYGPGCTDASNPVPLTITSDSCTSINTTLVCDIDGGIGSSVLVMGLSDQASANPAGCSLHLAGNIVTAFGVTGPAGFSLAIPNDTTLVGASFYLQGLEVSSSRTTNSTLIRVAP